MEYSTLVTYDLDRTEITKVIQNQLHGKTTQQKWARFIKSESYSNLI